MIEAEGLRAKSRGNHRCTRIHSASLVRPGRMLEDGRIIMIARPDGEIAFSDDNAATWTPPLAFGFHWLHRSSRTSEQRNCLNE